MKSSSTPFIPDQYKNDLNFLRKACRMNCSLITNNDLMQNDKECCLITASQKGGKLLHCCKIKDLDVILQAFKVNPNDISFTYGSMLINTQEYQEWKKLQEQKKIAPTHKTNHKKEILDEKEIVLNSVNKNGMNLRKFPSFALDRDVVLAAIKQNGTIFQTIDEKWKEDLEIVSTAIDSDPMNLKFLPNHFKSDRSLVMKAVTSNGFALKFAGSSFQRDKQIVLSSFTSNGKAVEFVHKSLWLDEEIVRCASRKTGRCLFHASECIKSNKELALQIIQKFPEGFTYLSNSLKTDRDFILSAIEKNHLILYQISPLLKQDNSFLIDALKRNSLIFPNLPESFRYDPNMIILSCKNSTQHLTSFLYYKQSLSHNFDFALQCTQMNGSALNCFSDFSHNELKLLALAAASSFFHQKHPNFKLLLRDD
ncbi:predicted protein [Naegleria gruberi]|uniref:Predicted protein n=1 Tax=Naegleria gruberi TaxID=5762 RepID=D2VA81_NAEGR|nr:uncharacterized protein NAEGRDRAFT_65768 [Naegleria gruberi]EFC46261.1 predicted protein [Naegleria gruberi]|eukprot:XP_002679005.1 predicted protein [Naegleria gruberi strain NEG-M]